ncbi:type II toxin-antitoxin system RelE/ParE family toxin, partial [Escherichia coli]|nr:type II toxin-antitoxin system RelE/ParE family toxin [Escherichia coli]
MRYRHFNVITTECFDEWFLAQTDELRESVYEAMGILEKFGPGLGRPYVDTLKGSKYP